MPDRYYKRLLELKNRYVTAIKLKNVDEILISGLAYYNYLRGGKITIADREEIQNSLLSAMDKLT